MAEVDVAVAPEVDDAAEAVVGAEMDDDAEVDGECTATRAGAEVDDAVGAEVDAGALLAGGEAELRLSCGAAEVDDALRLMLGG